MRTSPKLEDCLSEYGLFVRGVTRLIDAEINLYGLDANCAELALIGNIGSSYWTYFSQSEEFRSVGGLVELIDKRINAPQ